MDLKNLIDTLIKQNGGSICKVAERYGIKYQTLENWRKNTNKTKQIIDFYNKARKDLKLK